LGVGFIILTSPFLQTAGLESFPAGEPDLENGHNLFFAGECLSCHISPNQGDRLRLGGGKPLRVAGVGTFYPPNISPDPQYGIGSWTGEQFLRAMQAGVAPDGSHYFPMFPYTSFARMDGKDIRDMYGFLRTLPRVEGRAPPHELPFPL